MKPSVSIIIPNWNGAKIIQKSLPQVLSTSPEALEVLFIDDASQDDSLALAKQIAKTDKRLKVISNPKNLGFAATCNKAAKLATSPYISLLNTDIFPQPKYLSNALKLLQKDESIFGVGFAEIGKENWPKLFWSAGYIQYLPVTKVDKPHISGWVSGGGSLIRRDLFLKLGGFDLIYAPFYSEDVDLGYRAWKSGYKLYWNPTSLVDHKHSYTISKFPRHFTDYVKERNRLLTVWRNITDPSLLRLNYLTCFGRVLSGPNYIKIIRSARRQLRKFPAPIVFPKLTDRQIFALFDNS